MSQAPDIHADLITPLGAYLRLRAGARAGFLLESVEKGRSGGTVSSGPGARFVDFAEAEREVAAGRPVVGYLGYDHVAVLEPSVPLPETGPDLPESCFVVASTLVRFDHVASVAEVLAGDPADVSERLSADGAAEPGVAFEAAPTSRFPAREEYEQGAEGKGAHPRRRCLPDRPLAASGAADGRHGARALPLSPAHQPLALPLLLELDGISLVGSSPETSSSSRKAGFTNPIAGTTSPGAGDAERLLASEKDKGARHARRPRPQRPLARLRAGTVRVRFLEAERYSHVTHLVSEVAGELLAAPASICSALASLPGRSRGPEGERHADHLGARGIPPRPVRGCGGYALPTARSTPASPSARSSSRTGWRAAGGRRPRRRLRPRCRARGVPAKARGPGGGARRRRAE